MSSKIKSYFRIEYLLLFLCSIQFLSYFNPIIYLLFLYLIFKNKIDLSACRTVHFLTIVLFAVLYFLFIVENAVITDYITWIVSYIIGFSLVKDKKSMLIVLLIMGLGNGFYSTLISIDNYIHYGLNVGARVLSAVWWDGEVSATAHSCMFLIFSGLLYPMLFIYKSSFSFKILMVLFCISLCLSAIMSASRSELLYPPVIVVLTAIFYGIKTSSVKHFNYLIFITVILVILYTFDIFHIRTFFENQFIFVRFTEKYDGGIVENARVSSWPLFFNNFGKYLFGGLNTINPLLYMHNMFLDTFAFTGIFPFMLLIIIVFQSCKSLYKISKIGDAFEADLFFGVMIAFLLIFNTEPILQASSWFFSFYLIVFGMLDKRLVLLKRNKMNRATLVVS